MQAGLVEESRVTADSWFLRNRKLFSFLTFLDLINDLIYLTAVRGSNVCWGSKRGHSWPVVA